MNSLDMSQYLDVFLDEGREQLALLETNVLQMERGDHSADTLQVIFRAAHTLKGSSRAMGFLAVGDLTHEMENVLDDLRQDKLSVSTPIVNALLECLDALTALIDCVAATGADAQAQGTDIPALVSRLAALRIGESPVDTAPTAAVSLGDSTASIAISEYELASLADATAAGLAIFRISITLNADCLMKSVRVFMVLGTLESLGAVLVADPKEEQLEEEAFDQKFQLLFATEHPQAGVEQALATISEIEAISVAVWEQAGPPALFAATDGPPTPNSGGARADNSVDAGRERVSASSPSPPELGVGGPLTPPEMGAGGPSAATKPAPPVHTQTIRVEVARLDSLLNLIGELVIDRTQIARIGAELRQKYPHDTAAEQLVEATHRVARVTGELQDEIMKTRMLPIDGVFQRMPRMVRDLAQKTDKQLDFRMSGGDTELDRSVLEALGDPLIHLLRNSVDHGIELPEDRVAAGKPPIGVVALDARHEENHIVIEITDDGGGIHPDKIKSAALAKGVITQAEADRLSDRDAQMLIFAPGFSTAKTLSDISGRGVGMDIVRSNLEKLGGRVQVDSQPGVGSRFTIHLPLTLAIVRALLVGAGGGTYVLPLGNVVEMVRLGTGEGEVTRRSVGGQAMIVLRGRTVPLANMADVLCGEPCATSVDHIAEDAYVVIVGWAERQIGLCVEALVGEQEVVIKSLGTMLGDIPGLSGATILGDGRVGLIVDAAKAIQSISDFAEAAR